MRTQKLRGAIDGLRLGWGIEVGDGADALKRTMLPLARQSMTYQGKLYGLPYYTSYFGIIYNEKNGALAYDKNGDAKGGVIKFAILEKGLDIGAADFVVI